MTHYKQWIKQSLFICALAVSACANALPPKHQLSATDVKIVSHPAGWHRYEFTAGQYGYYFLWDYGPVEMIVHAVHGYDDQGNLRLSLPAAKKYIWKNRHGYIVKQEYVSTPEATLDFKGQGTARYATTKTDILIPEEFYNDETITHASVEFSVVDGRMSIGPLFPMLTDWGNESSVQEHLEILLW